MPPQTISYYTAEEETPSLQADVCTQQLRCLVPASPAAATAQQWHLLGKLKATRQPERVGPPEGRSCRFTRSDHWRQNASSQCMRKWWPCFNGCALRIFYNRPHFWGGWQPSWYTPHLTEAHLKRSNSINTVSNHCISILFTTRTMHLYILNLKSIYIIIYSKMTRGFIFCIIHFLNAWTLFI